MTNEDQEIWHILGYYSYEYACDMLHRNVQKQQELAKFVENIMSD